MGPSSFWVKIFGPENWHENPQAYCSFSARVCICETIAQEEIAIKHGFRQVQDVRSEDYLEMKERSEKYSDLCEDDGE